MFLNSVTGRCVAGGVGGGDEGEGEAGLVGRAAQTVVEWRRFQVQEVQLVGRGDCAAH